MTDKEKLIYMAQTDRCNQWPCPECPIDVECHEYSDRLTDIDKRRTALDILSKDMSREDLVAVLI